LKSANQKVIGFLSQERNLHQIVNYLAVEAYQENSSPLDKMSDDEMRTYFKYPFVVSEIIGCEVEEICEGIITKEHITKLLSYLVEKVT
jgi:tRNA(Ile)-lysidine synthase TilS/MesJ